MSQLIRPLVSQQQFNQIRRQPSNSQTPDPVIAHFMDYMKKVSNDSVLGATADAAIEGKTSEEALEIAAEMATKAGFACTSADVVKTMEAISTMQNGDELADEELETVSGGWGWNPFSAAEKKINQAGDKFFYSTLPQPD